MDWSTMTSEFITYQSILLNLRERLVWPSYLCERHPLEYLEFQKSFVKFVFLCLPHDVSENH